MSSRPKKAAEKERNGIRKGEIPLPVWIVDDPEYGRADSVTISKSYVKR